MNAAGVVVTAGGGQERTPGDCLQLLGWQRTQTKGGPTLLTVVAGVELAAMQP